MTKVTSENMSQLVISPIGSTQSTNFSTATGEVHSRNDDLTALRRELEEIQKDYYSLRIYSISTALKAIGKEKIAPYKMSFTLYYEVSFIVHQAFKNVFQEFQSLRKD
jgi:hypothetical protein